MEGLQNITLEYVGVLSLGLFVGVLLVFGLFSSGNTLSQALTVVGTALGGAPVVFLSGTNQKWLYPIGLIFGFFLVIMVYGLRLNFSVTQNGIISVARGRKKYEIFYPFHFLSNPKLTFPKEEYYSGRINICEQRTDGFIVEASKSLRDEDRWEILEWKATGKIVKT